MIIFGNSHSDMAGTFQDLEGLSTGPRMDSLHGGTLVNESVGNDQFVNVHVKIVFSVRNSGAKNFSITSEPTLGELEDCKGFVHRLAPDQVDHDAQFARCDTDVFGNSFSFLHLFISSFP